MIKVLNKKKINSMSKSSSSNITDKMITSRKKEMTNMKKWKMMKVIINSMKNSKNKESMKITD